MGRALEPGCCSETGGHIGAMFGDGRALCVRAAQMGRPLVKRQAETAWAPWPLPYHCPCPLQPSSARSEMLPPPCWTAGDLVVSRVGRMNDLGTCRKRTTWSAGPPRAQPLSGAQALTWSLVSQELVGLRIGASRPAQGRARLPGVFTVLSGPRVACLSSTCRSSPARTALGLLSLL